MLHMWLNGWTNKPKQTKPITLSFNTRSNHGLTIPVANLTVFQKGVWYSGSEIYNVPPLALKKLSYDIFRFKVALKKLLLTNSFYTLEEYYSWK